MMLYSFGPFFCYPWKPVFNWIYGTTYSLSYDHFYEQHKNHLNLTWHVMALFFQLFGNFVFLGLVDQRIPQFPLEYGFGDRWISLLTAVVWCAALIPPKECPLIVKIISVASVILGYVYSPLITAEKVELFGYIGFGGNPTSRKISLRSFTLKKLKC